MWSATGSRCLPTRRWRSHKGGTRLSFSMKQTGISGTSLCTRRFTVLYFTSGTSWYPKRFTLPALNLCGSLSLSLSLLYYSTHPPVWQMGLNKLWEERWKSIQRQPDSPSPATPPTKSSVAKFLLYYCEPCNTSSFPSPHQHSTLFSFVFCPLLFEGRFIPPPPSKR